MKIRLSYTYRTCVLWILCILGLGLNPNLYAQSCYRITYNISAIKSHGSVDNLDEEGKKLTKQVIERAKSVNYILIDNKEHSYFELKEILRNESDSPQDYMLFLLAKRFANFKKRVYANHSDQTIVFIKDMANKDFTVKRKQFDFKWVLQKETKQLLDYTALKAIGTYPDPITGEALSVEAWYIPSIPMQSGPDIFMGLPGLIAEVSIKGAVVSAINIETNVNLVIEPIDSSKAMTQAEYEDLRKNLTKKYIED